MTGLIGWWPLNEDSGGTAYDLSGNGNHGSLNGGVTQGVAGKSGLTSYSFDGSDDYADIPDANQYSEMSVSLCVYVRDATGIQDFVSTNNGSNRGWLMTLRDSDRFRWYWGDGGSYNEVGTVTPSSGNWYHLVGTFDGNYSRLYVNGTLDDETVAGNLSTQSGNNTGLGANFNNNRNSDSIISDVRIYNRALSLEEVQEFYEWGKGDYARPLNDQNSSSAVSRWAFDGNADDSWDSYSSSDETSSGYETGIRGQAKVFDSAQNDYVGVNSGNSLSEDFSSTGITVSGWVKTSSTGARKTIWAGNGANAWWDTRVNENERPEFWYANSGQNSHITASQTVENSEWYHLAFVCRPSDYRLNIYMNGSEVASGGNGNTPNTKQFSKTSIGDRSGDEYMDGSLDDVRIYDKALSPSEVFELYRWGTRGRDLRKLTVNSR